MGRFNFNVFRKKNNNNSRDDSFDYTPEEKKLLNEGKKHIGVTPFLLGTTIKQQKDYDPKTNVLDISEKGGSWITPGPLSNAVSKQKKLYEKEKEYKQEDIKKKCNIEFNETLPESVKEKIQAFCVRKGIYDMKSWNALSKTKSQNNPDELLDELKDDPEFVKWSVNAFFKDSLDLCIRKDDGTLKKWIVDEAIKQSILDE